MKYEKKQKKHDQNTHEEWSECIGIESRFEYENWKSTFVQNELEFTKLLLLAYGGFHLADAVSCVYAGPENGVMAANPLDIKEDIPVKLGVKTMILVDEVTNKKAHATHVCTPRNA